MLIVLLDFEGSDGRIIIPMKSEISAEKNIITCTSVEYGSFYLNACDILGNVLLSNGLRVKNHGQ